MIEELRSSCWMRQGMVDTKREDNDLIYMLYLGTMTIRFGGRME